jgi:divalent metal cation (Fe/Co/Zn/Cd) transporter
MAGAVLLGVGLNALFGWWWAEDVASLLFLFWLVGETREALEEAREGHGGDDDDN